MASRGRGTTEAKTEGAGDGALRRWLSVRGYGWLTSTFFRAHTPPQRMRERFERFGAVSRDHLQGRYRNLRFDDHRVGELEVESLCAVDHPERVLLYLHGGAFFMGSPESYRRRTMKMSYRCRAEVFVPAYRLAPEHPYPAALEDAVAAWTYVRAQRPEATILIAGDSAGGGLCLSLMLALRAQGLEQPAGAILFSPWADLTHSGASIAANDRRDLWLGGELLTAWARHYVPDGSVEDPGVSPLFADLSGLAPTLVLAADSEVLLDDARRIVASMRAVGGDARLHLGIGMQHDWPLTLPWLAESVRAWSDIESFARSRRSAAGGSIEIEERRIA